jgi:hypothetical protein
MWWREGVLTTPFIGQGSESRGRAELNDGLQWLMVSKFKEERK